MLVDRSAEIATNAPMLHYGVAIGDLGGRRLTAVVAGYGGPTRMLSFEDGVLEDRFDPVIADVTRRSIGVAAADIDGDGVEELYVLNTDTFAGPKRFGDRMFVRGPDGWHDLFLDPRNHGARNSVAGRSVAALDRHGSGRYGFLVANYGGTNRLYEVDENEPGVVADRSLEAGLAWAAGGRSLLAVPLFSDDQMDVIVGNELGPNHVFRHAGFGRYDEVGEEVGLADPDEHARGIAAVDVDGDGDLDLVCANWEGPHRLWLRVGDGFMDVAPPELAKPSRVRTVIAADLDNDGEVELFFNNIGEANRLFARREGRWEQVSAGEAVESTGMGTGAAVGDLDGDGALELLVAHGETEPQPLSLYSVPDAKKRSWVRVRPLTASGAPARGAVVRVEAGGRTRVAAVDAGSGYLCQMEPVAHFGLGDVDSVERIDVVWPGGEQATLDQPYVCREHVVPKPKP